MKISTVSAETVRIPVSEPTRMSTRLLNQRDYLVVTIEADGCAETGIGYVYAGTSGGSLLKAATSTLLAPILVGRDATAILDLWDRMYQETLLVGRRGLLLRAMSAVWSTRTPSPRDVRSRYRSLGLGGEARRPSACRYARR